MTAVRIAHAKPRARNEGGDQVVVHGFLIVLADDAGHRALPIRLRGQPGGDSLRELLGRGPGDTAAEAPEGLVTRLLHAAGARVTGVDIEASMAGAPETAEAPRASGATQASGGLLDPDAITARVTIAGPSGERNAPTRLGLALALAVASGAPVRVADRLMERYAVEVAGDDPLAPFLDVEPPPDPLLPARLVPAAGIAAGRPRFEPRNMGFADGLDRWDLDRGSLADAPPGDQAARPTDYRAAPGDGSAILSSGAPRPRGSAALVQTIYADDYRGTTVSFSADVRVTPGPGTAPRPAGLRVQILRRGWIVEPGASEEHDVTIPGGQDWARQAVTAPVPGDADLIRFGVVLTGPGRVEFRNPNLGAPETPGSSGP